MKTEKPLSELAAELAEIHLDNFVLFCKLKESELPKFQPFSYLVEMKAKEYKEYRLKALEDEKSK